jgi:hypothetical protein
MNRLLYTLARAAAKTEEGICLFPSPCADDEDDAKAQNGGNDGE